jgi:serine/threonine protein kinase
VEDKDTKSVFVMKRVVKQRPKDKVHRMDWRIEAELGMLIDSPYVVSVKAAFEDEHRGYILMEYCSNGDFENYLAIKAKSKETLSEAVSMSHLVVCSSSLFF